MAYDSAPFHNKLAKQIIITVSVIIKIKVSLLLKKLPTKALKVADHLGRRSALIDTYASLMLQNIFKHCKL